MSVAFRREGDDEHLEPKFELPIPPGPNRVTARGAALIGARVAELATQIAQPHDEAALTALKRDLRYWQTRQITAEVMPVPAGDVVEFGTTVAFRLGGKMRTLSLVGDDEADPAAGLIAFSAPLARALMGAEAGELLPFGGKDEAIEVLAVAAIAPDGAPR
ncbi:GreA/GreB family elongation factor [Novosphingobium sp. FKTRR1]|uniref:GreA/GreB family elongation factor n=1 Tax=Novosphingobium sp. FKTRR1 TaxID=2879118 RepID=UPI001CF02B04|nr:GreA/GreB family elongation factor [Novosphingobium sp. FKTRR1]